MDDFIAIYFNVSPQISTIRYHLPETLDPFDYMFHFRGVREGAPAERRALHRRHARGDMRGHRVHGAGQARPASRSTPAPGVIAGVSADTDAGFALRIAGAPVTEPQAGPPDLSRRQLRADGAALAPGPVRLEIVVTRPRHRRRGRVVQFPPGCRRQHVP